MNRLPVTSSNIASIGYDQLSRILEVEFTSKSIYRYEGVPQNLHTDLMAAESVGKFFNAHIKTAFQFKQAA